jgi:hypothetical protein
MPREKELTREHLLPRIARRDTGLAARLREAPLEHVRSIHNALQAVDYHAASDLAASISGGFISRPHPPERLTKVLKIIEDAAIRGHDDVLALSEQLREGFRYPSTGLIMDRALPLIHANVRKNRESAGFAEALWRHAEKDFPRGERFPILLDLLKEVYRKGYDPAPVADIIQKFGIFPVPKAREAERLRMLAAHASLAWTGGRKLPPHQLMEEAFHANSTIRNLPRTLKLQKEILERTGVVPTREMIRAYWKARK